MLPLSTFFVCRISLISAYPSPFHLVSLVSRGYLPLYLGFFLFLHLMALFLYSSFLPLHLTVIIISPPNSPTVVSSISRDSAFVPLPSPLLHLVSNQHHSL
jgi:hypothetical protein